MNKTNLTIRITNEGRQILNESASRLGLNRSAFIELAIYTQYPCIPTNQMSLLSALNKADFTRGVR